METFDENHAESVLERMAGTNARNEEHLRTAWGKFAFLTADDQEARCLRGACLTKDCYELNDRTMVCRHCGKDEAGRLRNANGDFLPR
jgi:hypothetical protein